MWIRRLFFAWLIPAAIVLPLWLFIGWGVFDAGGWAFLWVLFIAIPSVFVGQLALALLVRARPMARAERAVSWADVAGFGVWHLLTITLGFYGQAWWAPVFVLTVLAGIALFWLEVTQLWREARPRTLIRRTAGGAAYLPPERHAAAAPAPEVFVVTEKPRAQD
jgi:hypothetical protein